MKCCFVLTFVLLITGCSKSPTAPSARAGTSPATENVGENVSQNFEGTINNKLAIRMTLRRVGKDLLGSYQYTSQISSLDLRGTVDDNNNLVLNEFDSDGNQTGVFKGRFVSSSEIIGTWSKPNGDNQQSFSLKQVGAPAASGTPDPFLVKGGDIIIETHDDLDPGSGPPLDSEARMEFHKLWKNTFTDCGNGTYVTRTQYGTLKQVKNVTFIVQPRRITEADRLNGVEWSGLVRAKYTSERNWNNTWDKWVTAYAAPFMAFEKRNSQWSAPNMTSWRYQKAPCP